jgi:hypothetical protein
MKTLTAFPKGMWFVAPVPPLTQVIHEGAEGGCFAREDDGGLLHGDGTQAIDLRAVHAGGRTILDALHNGFTLDDKALAESRAVVSEHGNMSSAAVMFVLKPMLSNSPRGKRGRASDLAPVSLGGRQVDLSERSTLPEVMDNENVDMAADQRCLAELAFIHRVTFTHRPSGRNE